jgi:hydrogenase maturation protease
LKPLVIGLGNALRGDDAAGLEVARIVRDRAPEADVVLWEREPSDLIDLWAGAPLTVVVDAVDGAPPGTVHRLDPGGGEPDTQPRTASTHALGLMQVIELARSLGRMPRRLVLLGVGGETFETGAPLSSAARAGIDAAVASVLAELGSQAAAADEP